MVTVQASSRYRSALGVVQLARPINLLLALAGVGVGAYLAVGPSAFASRLLGRIILAGLSAVSVTAAANAINDAFDVTVDKVNRPLRPIPSGKVTARAATILWLAGALVGIGISLTLSVEHVFMASGTVVLAYLYSAVLKRAGFIGNLAVSAMVSISIIYGALATDTVGAAWIGSVLAFVITLAREITKDLEDIEGDVSDGVHTLPVAIGHGRARMVAIALIFLTILAAPAPFMYLSFDRLYLLGIAVTDFCLLGALWNLWVEAPQTSAFARASLFLKSAMVTGLAALCLA